jgi:hypothetical protein
MMERSMEESTLSTLRVSVADMVTLGVRNRRADSPAFLYQRLPMQAMTLMATLPRGSFAVSIPQSGDRGNGFPITGDVTPSQDGFILVYERKPNNRYEAVSVQYGNNACSVAEFFNIARQWVDDCLGGLKASGHYTSFLLTKEEWSFILRDNGYVAWESRSLSFNSSIPVSDNAIWVRIPVCVGNKASQEEGFRVFSQVEVALNPKSELPCEWISFNTYQTLRAARSILPDAFVPDLTEWLAVLTQESGLGRWAFRSGMLFGDPVEWWGACNRRRTVHEGIDFVEGFGLSGGKQAISENLPVRSIADGELVAILDDFIGKTVVVRHSSIKQLPGDVLHSFLSHIQPDIAGLGAIDRGQLVGRVAKPVSVRVSPHLHLTCAWIPEGLCVQEIGLDVIHPGFAPVALVNPCRL